MQTRNLCVRNYAKKKTNFKFSLNEWMYLLMYIQCLWTWLKSFLWVYYDTETLHNPEEKEREGRKKLHFPPKFFQFSDKQFNLTTLNSSFTVNKCFVHLLKHYKPSISYVRNFWLALPLIPITPVEDSSWQAITASHCQRHTTHPSRFGLLQYRRGEGEPTQYVHIHRRSQDWVSRIKTQPVRVNCSLQLTPM